jgi:glyoxylase-like metal-dependent hydrolase (beta-lactamase superfamily II)
MKVFSVVADYWKMDGGACFGVVPKTVWGKHVPSDENNKIRIATRCMLVDTGDRLILFDTGMGDKQSDKFFSYYQLFGNESLERSFEGLGYSFDQVTDVVFTHLHFDHVGGALRWAGDGKPPEPVFPHATHYVSREQWEWAMNPNPREKASFFPENYLPLYESGRLELIHGEGSFCDGVYLSLKHGHTRGQIIPIVDYKGRKVVFTADFIAALLNIPLAYVPAFDIEPLTSMKEKEAFYREALENDYVLFFQHDFDNECCTLQNTPKGVRAGEVFRLKDMPGR